MVNEKTKGVENGKRWDWDFFFFFCNNVLLKKSGKFLKYSETKVKNKAVLYFPPIKTFIAEFQLKTNDSWCW